MTPAEMERFLTAHEGSTFAEIVKDALDFSDDEKGEIISAIVESAKAAAAEQTKRRAMDKLRMWLWPSVKR